MIEMDKQESASTILLVDDDQHNLVLLKHIFSEQEFIIRTAMSGEEVFESVRHELPDIILLDIMMPGLDGFDVCTKLKADSKTRDIPVIFISALNQPEEKMRGFSVGGADYITKPFVKGEMLARVNFNLKMSLLQKELNTKAKELEIEKNKLKVILSSIADAVISTNLEGNIIFMNKTASELTGWDFKKALGKLLTEVFVLKNHQMLNIPWTSYEKVLKMEMKSFDMPVMVAKNGNELLISHNFSPVRNEENEIIGTVLTFRNETEKYKDAEKIKSLYQIFENSVNEIYIYDSQTLKFNFINKSGLKNLGYSLEECKKMTPVDIKSEFDNESFEKILEPLINNEKEKKIFETTHIRKDKSTYPVEVHLQKTQFEGNDVYVAIVLDISHRKKAEEEIRNHQLHLEEMVIERTHQLEEKNSELEEFNNLFVGREFRIKELKDKVKELEKEIEQLKNF